MAVPQGGWGALGERGNGVDLLAGANEGGEKAGDMGESPDVPLAVLGCVPILSSTSGTKDVSYPTVPKLPAGKTSTRDGAGMAQTPG